MAFTDIIFFMLRMVRESTQNALERALPQLGKTGMHMSQQAFSAARQKIKWEALKEMFHASVEGSLNEDMRPWRGYRIMAIDGTYITLPSNAALLEHFGGLGPERTSATALASLLYDLENDVILDAAISPVSGNERSLAEGHLRRLLELPGIGSERRELVIFDRGYPSHRFVKSLQDKEIAFVIRAWKGFVPEREMNDSRDCMVRLGKGGPQVRVVRLTLPTGEEEILLTSLPQSEVERGAFMELYGKRWGIETKYGELKRKLEAENFSGCLVDNVKQDFYATMTVANILSSFVREADRNVKKAREGSGNKYEYNVNVNHAIGVFKDQLIRVLVEDSARVRGRLMSELVGRRERRVVPIRPDRKVARKASPRKARFHRNHKSNC